MTKPPNYQDLLLNTVRKDSSTYSMENENFLTGRFGINKKVVEFCQSSEAEISGEFGKIDIIAEHNQYKVLAAMQKNRLSDMHFAATTGYGYNDIGRDTLEKIYADVFNTESALVRSQMVSGTHALATSLFGNLRHGDEVVSATGKPYDTMQGVIGIRPERGSLAEHGVVYKQADLKRDGSVDFDKLASLINSKTKMVIIQRSKGYTWRRSFFVYEIKEIIDFIKSIRENIICLVDNCYGEFVDFTEPSDVGADITVGSLIKNPGGGIAPVGGYIVGKEEFVENAAFRLTCPGMGREVGPSLGATHKFLQGLFLAPQAVSGSVKGAVFAASVFEELGFDTLPSSKDKRTDIVQAICLKSPEAIIAFCKGIQAAAPVDSFVSPEPWDMPGYADKVIMAAGAFIQGSSIELSADAPITPPYNVFLQGGLTWFHAKLGVLFAVNHLVASGLVDLG